MWALLARAALPLLERGAAGAAAEGAGAAEGGAASRGSSLSMQQLGQAINHKSSTPSPAYEPAPMTHTSAGNSVQFRP